MIGGGTLPLPGADPVRHRLKEEATPRQSAAHPLFPVPVRPRSEVMASNPAPALVDAHGRTISYLRISVTDRCDLRCRYCMAEQMTFLPRSALLSAGGDRADRRALHRARRHQDPADRRRAAGAPRRRSSWSRRLGRHVGHGLDELTMTTNGTRLRRACRGAVRRRHPADQRQPRQPRSRTASATSPAMATSRRCSTASPRRKAAGLRGQDQHGRAQGPERGRDRADARLVRRRGPST